MPHKFLALEPEKQSRIINAAIKEFVHKGYNKASTNEMVKDADISKGLLFHYFSNKKDLFLFMYDHSLEIIGNDFFGKIDISERDIMQRMRQIMYVKCSLVAKYPDLFDFIHALNNEDSDEVKLELQNRNNEFMEKSYSKLYENIDTSLFREYVDVSKALNIMIWTMEGISTKKREKAKVLSLNDLHYDEILAEMDTYLAILKKSFYK